MSATWPVPAPRTCFNCGATYVGAHDCSPRLPVQADVTIYDGYLDLKARAESAEADLAATRAEVGRLRNEVERHCSRADQANNRRRRHLAEVKRLRAGIEASLKAARGLAVESNWGGLSETDWSEYMDTLRALLGGTEAATEAGFLRCEARTPVPVRCELRAGHDGPHTWEAAS